MRIIDRLRHPSDARFTRRTLNAVTPDSIQDLIRVVEREAREKTYSVRADARTAFACAVTALVLDRFEPGWHDRIDTERLDMATGTQCVFGQLYDDYGSGVDRYAELLRGPLRELLPHVRRATDWCAPASAWVDLIGARRLAAGTRVTA